MHHEHKNTNTK